MSISKIIAFILSITLVFSFSSEAWATPSQDLWQAKADLLIDALAQEQKIPDEGDPEKYLWPTVIARLTLDPQDTWSQEKLLEFTKRDPKTFYVNREAFSAPGITRLLYLWENLEAEKQYLNFIFATAKVKPNYNFWQSGGTENFINMLRTSNYLLASRAIKYRTLGAQSQRDIAKTWILTKGKTIYQYGVSEWDSSTYTTYNLIGWLNLYDFAEDPEIKQVAQAVLDYYATTVALKYSQGVYGGAEQRGGQAIAPYQTVTDYLSWLWFSDYLPTSSSFFQWPLYLPTIHAITSSYRPPQEALYLAHKSGLNPSYYKNYKSNYSLNQISYPEYFYSTKNYTLGTVITELGQQIINWKLVTLAEGNQQPQVFTGSNSFYNSNYNGLGKTPFDYYYQDHNHLFQLTYVPDLVRRNIKQQNLRKKIEDFFKSIPCGKTCNFLLIKKLDNLIQPAIYPLRKEEDKYLVSNYLSYPNQIKLVAQEKVYFLQTNQNYLAIYPLAPKTTITEHEGRNHLNNIGSFNQIVGFIVKVEDQEDYQSFEQFQQSVLQTSLPSLNGATQIDYQSWRLKLVPSNNRLDLTVNGQLVSEVATYPPLYEGPHLEVNDGILEVKGDQSIYRIDYQGFLPNFTRTQLRDN